MGARGAVPTAFGRPGRSGAVTLFCKNYAKGNTVGGFASASSTAGLSLSFPIEEFQLLRGFAFLHIANK